MWKFSAFNSKEIVIYPDNLHLYHWSWNKVKKPQQQQEHNAELELTNTEYTGKSGELSVDT